MNKRLLAAISGYVLTIGIVSSAEAVLMPYDTSVSYEGNATATAYSTVNVATAEASALGTPGGNLGHATAYASSESALEVRGGSLDATILVDIIYNMEIGTWKSLNTTMEGETGGSIASANSLVSIADVLDEEVSIWEAELDQHTTGTMTSGGDDAVDVTATISLLSGHDYIVALEAFAEAWATEFGWANAEAFVDPVFAINTGQVGWDGFSLNHITPAGSSVSTVPLPSAVWLFGSGLLGLVGLARHRKAA